MKRLGGSCQAKDVFGRTVIDQTDVAIKLARDIVAGLRQRFGSDTDIVFLYTTRAREDWIRSIYGHLLRSINLTADYDDFHTQLKGAQSPNQIARQIAKALAPIPVHTASLEDYGNHLFGPAAAILDLVGIPRGIRAKLVRIPPQNFGQDSTMEARFLELNRSNRSKTELKKLKDQLINADSESTGS